METGGESRKGGIPEAKERNAAGKSDSIQTMSGARDSAREGISDSGHLSTASTYLYII